jgi:hypothetical protein
MAVGKGAAEGVDMLAETMMGQEAKQETAQAIGTLTRYPRGIYIHTKT